MDLYIWMVKTALTSITGLSSLSDPQPDGPQSIPILCLSDTGAHGSIFATPPLPEQSL